MSDLRAALVERGVTEVDDSLRRRSEYASDASLYRIAPQAVVFPRHADEVVAALDACRSLGVPVTGRGAGTSIAGNAVGRGLVIDYSRHLNRVVGIDAESGTARIQPGIVLAELQKAAAPYALRFGPDPSTHNRATLGGMIGNNACGSRALAYGRTSDNVVEADVLFGNGERSTLTRGRDGSAASSTVSRLATLVERNLGVVRTSFGRFPRQGSGYALEHLLPERMSPVQAYVGTEGTWGQLLEATVRLVPRPSATALLVVGYPSMAEAADAAPALVPLGPVAIEGLDSRIVDIVARTHGAASVPPLPRGAGWLMVEVPGQTTEQARAGAAAMAAIAGGIDHLVLTDPAQVAVVWRIREDGAGLVSRPRDGHFALAGFEDAAVPPAALGRYLREFDLLLDRYQLHGVPYGHFGDGCVHVRIDFALSTGDGRSRFSAFLDDAAALVASHGGSISGEHGDGRARSSLLGTMYPPEALRLFADAKLVVDPDGLCNPGVIVDPSGVTDDLRLSRPVAVKTPLALSYPHDAERFDFAVARCTGVGKCRADSTATGGVMCPSYLATKDEKDSTRGPRPRAPGPDRRRAPRRLAFGRRGRVTRSLPCLQGMHERVPDRHRHADLQGRGAPPAVPPPIAPAHALHAGKAAAAPAPRRRSRRPHESPQRAHAVAVESGGRRRGRCRREPWPAPDRVHHLRGGGRHRRRRDLRNLHGCCRATGRHLGRHDDELSSSRRRVGHAHRPARRRVRPRGDRRGPRRWRVLRTPAVLHRSARSRPRGRRSALPRRWNPCWPRVSRWWAWSRRVSR